MNIIKNNKFKDLVEILKSIPCQDVGLYQRKCTYKLFNSKNSNNLNFTIMSELNQKKNVKHSKTNTNTYLNKGSKFDKNKPSKHNLNYNFDNLGNKTKFKHNSDITTPTDISISKSINHKYESKSNLKSIDFSNETHSNIQLPKSIQIFKEYDFIKIDKSINDCYTQLFMRSVDPVFKSIRDKKFIYHTLKNVKIKVIDIFNKQDLYKKYEFSTKDFKKSDLEEKCMSNQPLTINMVKVIACILDVNLIYKNLDLDKAKYQYMTAFLENRATILMFEYNNQLFSIQSKNKNYIRGSELLKYLNFKKIYTEIEISKFSLDEIQNISKMKNINIKKDGKSGKINKKKDDLIKEIVNL